MPILDSLEVLNYERIRRGVALTFAAPDKLLAELGIRWSTNDDAFVLVGDPTAPNPFWGVTLLIKLPSEHWGCWNLRTIQIWSDGRRISGTDLVRVLVYDWEPAEDSAVR